MNVRPWIVGAGLGVATGLLVASAMSFVDWRMNSGGIFHNEQGTNWLFVRETWVSWFIPVVLSASAVLAPLVAWRARRGRQC